MSALQQAEHVLRYLVCLGQHGRTGLLQDLGAGQFGGFLGEVGIADAAARGRQVLRGCLQVGHHRGEAVLDRTEVGADAVD